MRHLITVCGVVVVAFVWGSPFVWHVLDVVWPIAAAALSLFLGAAAVAGSIVMIGAAVNAVKRETPIEIIQPMPLTTFVKDVRSVMGGDEGAHDDRWRVAVIRFCFIGNMVGFSVRRMQPYIERLQRQVYVDLLTSLSVLVTDKGGTRWGYGWNYPRLRNELKYHRLELPYPTSDPPDVRWLQHSSAHTAHTVNTGEIVCTSPMR